MTPKKAVSALVLACSLPLATPAAADVYWSDFSLNYLYGTDYEMNFTPQPKWNAGKHLGFQKPLYAGIEYSYWNNKFGIPDKVERNASLLLKWHF